MEYNSEFEIYLYYLILPIVGFILIVLLISWISDLVAINAAESIDDNDTKCKTIHTMYASTADKIIDIVENSKKYKLVSRSKLNALNWYGYELVFEKKSRK